MNELMFNSFLRKYARTRRQADARTKSRQRPERCDLKLYGGGRRMTYSDGGAAIDAAGVVDGAVLWRRSLAQ